MTDAELDPPGDGKLRDGVLK